MCLNAGWIYSNKGAHPLKIKVTCKECWQCRSHRLNDFAGRALAEAATSEWSAALTLTYRDQDDLSHKVLTPRHFQNAMKLMRKNHNVRYLVAGEYGELRGRAHFHVLLFGKGKAPLWPQRERTHIPEWVHGHVYADHGLDYKKVRYVCKYLLKWEKTQSWISMSKKPSLGHEWFQQRAEDIVSHGVLPRGFTYVPPEGKRDVEYMMTGATKRDYIAAVIRHWRERFGELNMERLSDWVAQSIEKHDFEQFRKECEESIDKTDAGTKLLVSQVRDKLDRERPTERQVNKVFLDTNRWNEDY